MRITHNLRVNIVNSVKGRSNKTIYHYLIYT